MSATPPTVPRPDAGPLKLEGRLTVAEAAATDALLRQRFAGADAPGAIDLGGVEQIDTIGAWLLHRTLRDHPGVKLANASPQAERLLVEVSRADHPARIRPETLPFGIRELYQFGRYIVDVIINVGEVLGFVGLTIAGTWRAIRRSAGLRFNAVVVQMEQAGINALGIIGLMAFLVGIVIAQQGAIQLQQFGADIYVVNLIGVITFRELGILIAAIMVAGRSASAFAAQIGSMKLAEEVDALRTIGLDPIQVLVLPRVIGLTAVMPILSFFSSMLSILGGGLFCWFSLDMPPSTYVERIREAVSMTDFAHGIIKAPVFGAIIAIIGCFQGFQVTGNAESVGLRTTAAVVQSIFLVIVLDAFFAVFFTAMGFK
jgi:phospholipid/cholesterol/gamma-HCH transport system permease protein